MEEKSFISVVMTDTNVVRNKLFRLADDLSESQLQMLGTLLNTGFTALSPEGLKTKLAQAARHAAPEAYSLIEMVVSFAVEVLEELGQRSIHTAGLAHLLDHPEYQSLEKAQPLMTLLSEADFGPLPARIDGSVGTDIVIGPENVNEALKDSSVVMASYDLGDGMKGLIGVVGPTRMDYAKISARLAYVAQELSGLFKPGAGSLPPGSGTKE